jgi:hypothetical protein
MPGKSRELRVESWELGVGSWELGVGSWELRMRVPEVSSGLSAPSRELGVGNASVLNSIHDLLQLLQRCLEVVIDDLIIEFIGGGDFYPGLL